MKLVEAETEKFNIKQMKDLFEQKAAQLATEIVGQCGTGGTGRPVTVSHMTLSSRLLLDTCWPQYIHCVLSSLRQVVDYPTAVYILTFCMNNSCCADSIVNRYIILKSVRLEVSL